MVKLESGSQGDSIGGSYVDNQQEIVLKGSSPLFI